MARARNIKPGFFTNADLLECDPLARILFAGLWCEADRRGILQDRPKTLKIKILPGDNCDVNDLLNQLASRGFIVRYQAEGIACIKVVNFGVHQNPHQNEKNSELPDESGKSIDPDTEQHQSTPVLAPEQHQSDPADSLNTDSLNRIPETRTNHSPESGEDHPPGDSPKPVKRSAKPDLTGFTDWYDRYPLKVSRADAERAWSKLSPGDRQAALDGLLAQQHWPTMQRGYEFLKHPATWLNKRCWEDEPPQLASGPPGHIRDWELDERRGLVETGQWTQGQLDEWIAKRGIRHDRAAD